LIPIKLKRKLEKFVFTIENTWERKNSESESFSFKKIVNFAEKKDDKKKK
jgi:hypothetical protein